MHSYNVAIEILISCWMLKRIYHLHLLFASIYKIHGNIQHTTRQQGFHLFNFILFIEYIRWFARHYSLILHPQFTIQSPHCYEPIKHNLKHSNVFKRFMFRNEKRGVARERERCSFIRPFKSAENWGGGSPRYSRCGAMFPLKPKWFEQPMNCCFLLKKFR